MRKKQNFYTSEFKAEAIKVIEENKGNISETARQLHANTFKLVQ